MSAPVRRNDPCPCGSGRRYKECHGSLVGEADAIEALARRALAAHQQGRIDEAEAGYREILQRRAGHPVATHYLGLAAWQRGDPQAAERLMREAIAADAKVADFHNNLGLLLRDTGRAEQALECYARALAAEPRWIEAHNNRALALESLGRFEEALAAYRSAIAAQPRFAAARQNLARALLALGRLEEGWREYRWRLLAQGLADRPPDPAWTPLPAALAGRRFELLAEQGLGDVLFFLRFAPALVARGAALAFRGDARLHGILERTGLFALGVRAPDESQPGLEALRVGDLPGLLEAHDAARLPPPLALRADERRLREAHARLQAAGPRPWIALTWRSGVSSRGPSGTQVKEVPLEAFGAALRGAQGTFVAIQRLPRAGELERLGEALGAPVHDCTGHNDDLEAMLALLAAVDRYAGVSNTNTHLHASLARASDVLVANPVEWRWQIGEASPWFPAARLYRQRPDGDWSDALRGLRRSYA